MNTEVRVTDRNIDPFDPFDLVSSFCLDSFLFLVLFVDSHLSNALYSVLRYHANRSSRISQNEEQEKDCEKLDSAWLDSVSVSLAKRRVTPPFTTTRYKARETILATRFERDTSTDEGKGNQINKVRINMIS